ncbi:MAG: TlpA disulfide reductase family protein [Actinobacteria bacterium]|nr:TlpA disulfide reductase family protein [Actinomycetota bacterium]
MKRYIFALSLLLILTSCAGGGISTPNEDKFVSGNGAVVMIAKNDRQLAPILNGATLNGLTFQGASNKVTIVNVWASWCSPCRAEAPALEALANKYPEVQFVGILTRDNLSSAKAFVKRFALTYPTLTDDAILLKFHGQLMPNAIPTTLALDKENRIAARISGEITVLALENIIKKLLAE